jgi:hypothetical protein
MGYYIRVLAKKDGHISVSRLQKKLNSEKLEAKFEFDEGEDVNWTQITVSHLDGTAICSIERNEVSKNSLGEAEINEFIKECKYYKPESAARWLEKYLPNIKAVFALQILYGSDVGNGWGIIQTIIDEITNTFGGIVQADHEGFSNEEGYHIIWEFGDNASGDWYMAILDSNEEWVKFKMDLGNKKHREAFLQGKVPKGVRILD